MPINTKSRAKGWIRGGGVNTTVDDSQRVANSIFKFINIKHFVTLIQELWNYFTYNNNDCKAILKFNSLDNCSPKPNTEKKQPIILTCFTVIRMISAAIMRTP